MAVIKSVLIREPSLTAIGDAIRAKTGKTDLLSPAQMAVEIAAIQTGAAPYGFISEETIAVTQDYTTDTTGNAKILNELFVPSFLDTADHSLYLLYFTNNNTSDWKACNCIIAQRLSATVIVSINWRNKWADGNNGAAATRGLHVSAGTIIHRIKFGQGG